MNDGNKGGEASQVLGPNMWDKDPITLTLNTTSPSLIFDLNTTLFGYHNATSDYNRQYNDGISYNILNNGTVSWEFLHDFYMPTGYSDFEFIVYKPKNWKIISAQDQMGSIPIQFIF